MSSTGGMIANMRDADSDDTATGMAAHSHADDQTEVSLQRAETQDAELAWSADDVADEIVATEGRRPFVRFAPLLAALTSVSALVAVAFVLFQNHQNESRAAPVIPRPMPSQSPLSMEDQKVLSDLDKAQIPYSSKAWAVKMARDVCAMYDGGQSSVEITQRLIDKSDSPWTPLQAAQVVVSASDAYCLKHSPTHAILPADASEFLRDQAFVEDLSLYGWKAKDPDALIAVAHEAVAHKRQDPVLNLWDFYIGKGLSAKDAGVAWIVMETRDIYLPTKDGK